MTPKEKAEELYYKMQLDWACDSCHNDWAKECALIAVDDILDAINGMVDKESGYSADEYYLEVKQEIEKL
jgi:hypothetical protein